MEIGIDSGGTNTRFAIAEQGVIMSEYDVAADLWRRGTLLSTQANADRLMNLIPDEYLGRTDIPIAIGAHGCDTLTQCELLATWMGRHHAGPIRVVNDSELFGPTLGISGAISVVCGTGSIVVGRSKDNELVKVGGYGWLLGDPGSAASLVRQSVISILEADDKGIGPGPLARSLMKHYNSVDLVQLGYDFTDDADMIHWGALAPLVFEAANAGDFIAARVIERDGRQLAADVHTLRGRGVDSNDVVMAGGVIIAQPQLERAFTSALASSDPDVRVYVLRDAPVKGAVTLAGALRPPQR